MAGTLVTLVLLAVSMAGVDAVCSVELRDKLLAVWKGCPPTNIVKQWVTGPLTTVWMSPALTEAQPIIHPVDILHNTACYQTTLHPLGEVATDHWTFNNGTTLQAQYYVVMETPAIVTVLEDLTGGFTDMHLTVAYMKDGVFGLYECDTSSTEDESYTPGVMIRVVNYDKTNLQQTAAIAAAKKALTDLGLGDGVDVSTKCPRTPLL